MILAVIIAAFGISGCKKYPDGPTLSLASKKARVVNSWKIDKMILNGVDQVLGDSAKSIILEIKNDGTFENRMGPFTVNGVIIPNMTITGTWEFDSKKENIMMKFTGFAYQILNKILRLKTDELWVEYTLTVKTEIHFITK